MNKQEAMQEGGVVELSIKKHEMRIAELDAIINAPDKEVFPPDGEWLLDVDGLVGHSLYGLNANRRKQGNVFQTKEHAELASTYVKHHLMMLHVWLKVTGGELVAWGEDNPAWFPAYSFTEYLWIAEASYSMDYHCKMYTKEQCQEACYLLNGGILDDNI